MKRRAILPVVLGVVLAVSLAAWLSYRSHPVEEDLSNLEECVLEWYNRGRQLPLSPEIRLYDSVKLGERQYVLLELDEDLGWTVLEQGIAGHWKITRLSYGSGNFREEIIEYEGEKVLLFGGRNTGFRIAAVEVDVAGATTCLEIPAAERFLVHTKLCGFVESNHILPDAFRFYDAAGEDITALVDWNGMGR